MPFTHQSGKWHVSFCPGASERLCILPPELFRQPEHPCAEALPPCQRYQRGVALPDTHRAADLLWNHDPPQVVPTCQAGTKINLLKAERKLLLRKSSCPGGLAASSARIRHAPGWALALSGRSIRCKQVGEFPGDCDIRIAIYGHAVNLSVHLTDGSVRRGTRLGICGKRLLL